MPPFRFAPIRRAQIGAALLFALVTTAIAAPLSTRPTALRCDSLTEPLGIDSPQPILSWQLRDTTWGARQTAYEITVFSKQPTTSSAKPDVWDSGRVSSATSNGVPYGGPALLAETRYYWRVEVWGKDEQPYPVSAATWWETGLLKRENWHAQWIGYEEPELHSIRESGATWITNATPPSPPAAANDTHHAFRFPFTLKDDPAQTVTRAVLYATGEDTAAAWVNGKQFIQSQPLSPSKHMPWVTYVRQDVTSALRPGANLLAIEITHYLLPGQTSMPATTPMSACLYIVFRDGSTRLYSSASPGWTAMLEAPAGWWSPADTGSAAWPAAIAYVDGAGKPEDARPWPTGPVAALRHTFEQNQPVISARLYATALGAYKFRINGSPVGDQILAPGWMDYREHVAYQVYDVTRQIKRGSNTIAAWLAPGWYSTPLEWLRQGNNYGATQPALKAQLRLEHTDGSVEWIATDASWKANTSPILQAEIYDGETMDARNETPGWDSAAGFSDAAWKPVAVVTPKEPQILAQFYQPIREEKVLIAKTITQPSPGIYILDFGQNMSAVPRLRVHGHRGDDIQLRFAEVLKPDGTLYTDNLRTAKVTDHYILSGVGAVEQWQPLFTFHGFRYAEITGLHYTPTTDALQAVVLHTDAPFTAHFSSSDPMINQLWSNILWGQRSNFVGLPTDCPQRDERLGWSADAQVFWRTAAYNMDLDAFSRKFSADLLGTQAGTPMYGIYAPGVTAENPGFAAAWSDAGVIIPWTGWLQSGNPRIIAENWTGMGQYLDAIEQQNPDHLWRNGFGTAYGDWLTPTITTPEDLLATAYWAYDVTLMRQMAVATGRSADADRYAALFTKIKAAFQKAYVRDDGFIGTVDHYPSIPPPTIHPEAGGPDKNKVVETQTGYVLALYMNLLPDGLRAAAANHLVQKIEDDHWRLGTGFLGTPYLLEVLSDTGHSDVAYRLLLSKDYPSWGYQVEHGATTMWERWNGDQMRDDPSMNSYNHYAYGAVAEWLYRYAAGIDTLPAGPGYATVYLHPQFDGRLGKLSFDYDSPYGAIHSDWITANQRVTWRVTVPPNATAVLPLDSTNATSFLLDGAPLTSSNKLTVDDAAHVRLPAGTYIFTATLAQQPPTTAVAHR
jgi:alpha-L-rhamnosidase